MLKRAALVFTELAAFGGVVALLLTGCGQSEVAEPGPAFVGEVQYYPPGPEFKLAGEAAALQTAAAAKDQAMTPLSDTPLIPRDVLFGNPERAQAKLSPDGQWLSFLAPVNGVLNVWVAPADKPGEAAAITDDKVRGIRSHSWSYDARYVVYAQDKGGDENWHLYATEVATKATKDLTPIDGVNATLAGASEKFPDEILVGLNDRNPQLHDLYRVSLETGERRLLQLNPGVAGLVTDDDYQVRMAVNYTPAGGLAWLKPQGEPGEQGYTDWAPIEEWGPEDAMTSGPVGYSKTGRVLYFEDSRERNTAGLFARDLDSGETRLIADDRRADVGGILMHPTEKTPQAVAFTYSRREWQILDESIRRDVEFLSGFADGEWQVASRTLDDTQWIVAYVFDSGPVKYYRYRRPASGVAGEPSMTYLFSNRDDLDDYPLVTMHTPVIKSRDGLSLVSYLSLPPGSDPDGDGVPAEPVPMVLDVHGGPGARDGWGLNGTHQWLANRGYAVLSVNYRGSTGFGKEFLNAANGEWSGKMHDDLLDAVEWAVQRGVAQGDKVCIMGGSYGGYATLVGMTYTPDVFACGVDIVGPSSLVTLLQNIPPYWAPFMPVMKLRVGDVSTEQGREALRAMSPLTFVDKIERPLLIGQGANDPRVTQLEADQIVQAMQQKGIPVTYVLYPDEGHGFRRPENNTSFNAVTEAFLAEHLGGRYEPIGDDFEGASLHVPAGATGVPGLAEALPADRNHPPPSEAKGDSP
ncbi:MAG: alpha/beta fold hydrolase [Planctomycetota bacterium]